MEEKLNGIVLGAIDYSENDKILTVFTLEAGTITTRIKGVKKAGAKLKFASEPFCFAEFIINTSQNRRVVTGASLIDSFYPLRENLQAFYAGCVCLEFVKRFLKEAIISAQVFSLLVNTLKQLSYGDENKKSVLVKFLIELLKYAGYGLDFSNCFSCEKEITGRTFFDKNTGSFYCEDCAIQGCREVKHQTLLALQSTTQDKEVDDVNLLNALKLIHYYVSDKADGQFNSLSEFINLP